jgi:hypothetical protein
VRKLFGGRAFSVDCLLAGLRWHWFCRVGVEVNKTQNNNNNTVLMSCTKELK